MDIFTRKFDITFFALVLILQTIGLVMLFSASYAYSYEYYGNSYKFISRQAGFAVFGVIVMLIVSCVDYHRLKKWAWVIFIAVLLILGVLLIMPPMISGMDVKRWLVIGPINFQPSEFAKFAIVLLFAGLISANQKQIRDFKFNITCYSFVYFVNEGTESFAERCEPLTVVYEICKCY